MRDILAKTWRFLHLTKHTQLFILRLFNDRFLVGVTGIIFNESNEILLFKHTYRQHAWGLPGGYLKAKEHPKEGLEREIEEESNLIVSLDKQLKVRTDRETARLDICYIGTYLSGTFVPSYEVSEASFFAFDKLPLLRERDLLLIKHALDQRKTPENGTGHIPAKTSQQSSPSKRLSKYLHRFKWIWERS